MADLRLNVLDDHATISIQLIDQDGDDLPTADATTFHAIIRYKNVITATEEMTKVNDTGLVSIQFPADTLTAGINNMTVKITWSGGTYSYSTTPYSIQGLA